MLDPEALQEAREYNAKRARGALDVAALPWPFSRYAADSEELAVVVYLHQVHSDLYADGMLGPRSQASIENQFAPAPIQSAPVDAAPMEPAPMSVAPTAPAAMVCEDVPPELNTDDNIRRLANTLWAETSGMSKHDDDELSAIAFVAVNRVDETHTLADVLGPGGKSKWGVWNNSGKFRERWESAPSMKNYDRCLRIATEVLSGQRPCAIGKRALFFHPTGCPKHEEGKVMERRYLMETTAGLRWAPNWGKNDPLTVGHAVFCDKA